MLNELVLDRTGGTHLALGCVSAVEAHERIGEGVVVLALDVLVVYVLRNGVVDIEQRNCVSGNAQTDVFAQRAVDIYLAGYRDTAAYKAAVYIAGLKAELGRERRPALVCKCNVLLGALVLLCPV